MKLLVFHHLKMFIDVLYIKANSEYIAILFLVYGYYVRTFNKIVIYKDQYICMSYNIYVYHIDKIYCL